MPTLQGVYGSVGNNTSSLFPPLDLCHQDESARAKNQKNSKKTLCLIPRAALFTGYFVGSLNKLVQWENCFCFMPTLVFPSCDSCCWLSGCVENSLQTT